MRTPPARRCRHSGLRVARVPVADRSRFACVRDLAQHVALTPHLSQGIFFEETPSGGVECSGANVKRHLQEKTDGISDRYRWSNTIGLIGPVWYGSLLGAVLTDGISESDSRPTKTSIFLNFSHCGRILRRHPNLNLWKYKNGSKQTSFKF
jgi:hypothetical protein